MHQSLLLLFIVAQFFFSCTHPNVIQDKTLLDERSDLYRLVIEETGTKMDTQGVIKCKNYMQVTENSDSIHVYGFKLKALIAYLSGVDEQSVVVKKSGFQNIAVNLLYQNLSQQQPINKELILHKLEQLYQFRTSIDSLPNIVYDLVITDNNKMNKYIVHCSNSRIIQSSEGRLDITSQPITQITKTLNDITPERIYTTSRDSSSCYSFSISFSSFEDLCKKLTETYGLTLTKSTQNTPVIYVTTVE